MTRSLAVGRQAERGYQDSQNKELLQVLDEATVAVTAVADQKYKLITSRELDRAAWETFVRSFSAKSDRLSAVCARLQLRLSYENQTSRSCIKAGQAAGSLTLGFQLAQDQSGEGRTAFLTRASWRDLEEGYIEYTADAVTESNA